MKKIYILFLIILLLQSFIFISCNSETSPTVDKIMSEYFPTTIGNWWKYENWVLDSNGLRTKNISVDSVVVENIIYYEGKNSAVLDFNFKSDILKVQEFMTYYIQRTSTIMPKDTVKTDMESSYQDLYCKGIGQVYSKYMMVKNLGYERQGYETTLIDYYVK